MRFLVGEAEAGDRIDRALAALCGDPRSAVQRWIEAGRVTLNERPARASQKVSIGDVIDATPPDATPSELTPEAIPLAVLHEDEALIVVDKPAGLVVHPAPGHPGGTLVNALLHHCKDLAGIGGTLRPGIVHRLDRGTSGVMVAAKHDAAHLALARQFHDHTIEREYAAWVRGVPGAETGRSDRPIGRHPRDRKRMSTNTPRAREAHTAWRVAARYPKHDVARLAVFPETGRTHQIRVHLAAEGWPILGDPVYGRRGSGKGASRDWDRKLGRPALHARVLGFTHPTTNEALRFEAPFAPELAALDARLAELAE